jgi:hypothetical protein
MKSHPLWLFLALLVCMIPIYFVNRSLQRVMKPRESAGRFFLFLFANFLLIVVYTVSIVALIIRLFPAN